jgi:hypothetical protein
MRFGEEYRNHPIYPFDGKGYISGNRNHPTKGGPVKSISHPDAGLKRLIRQCRNDFRRPENLKYYSEKDFREAERKYIRFCLTGDPENPARRAPEARG